MSKASKNTASDQTGTKILREIKGIQTQLIHLATQQPVDRFLDELFYNERLSFFLQFATVGHFDREFINQHLSGPDCTVFCVLYNTLLIFRQMELDTLNSIDFSELSDLPDLPEPPQTTTPTTSQQQQISVEQQFFLSLCATHQEQPTQKATAEPTVTVVETDAEIISRLKVHPLWVDLKTHYAALVHHSPHPQYPHRPHTYKIKELLDRCAAYFCEYAAGVLHESVVLSSTLCLYGLAASTNETYRSRAYQRATNLAKYEFELAQLLQNRSFVQVASKETH